MPFVAIKRLTWEGREVLPGGVIADVVPKSLVNCNRAKWVEAAPVEVEPAPVPAPVVFIAPEPEQPKQPKKKKRAKARSKRR